MVTPPTGHRCFIVGRHRHGVKTDSCQSKRRRTGQSEWDSVDQIPQSRIYSTTWGTEISTGMVVRCHRWRSSQVGTGDIDRVHEKTPVGVSIPPSSETEDLWDLKVYTDKRLDPSRPYKSESLTILMICTSQCNMTQRTCFLNGDTTNRTQVFRCWSAQVRCEGGLTSVEEETYRAFTMGLHPRPSPGPSGRDCRDCCKGLFS